MIAAVKLTPRLTFWITVAYGWTILAIVFAVGGGDGGPVAIAAFIILIALLLLDAITYYSSGAEEPLFLAFLGAVGTVIWRPFFTACVVVGPFWIADRVFS